VHFIELPGDNPITIWPQDPFLVLAPGADGERPTLLTSKEFDRAGDRLMAETVAESAGLELRASELSFEGGNIVSDAEHVFVGENTIRHNAHVLNESLVEVVLRLQEELGRRVLVVGPYPQPVAHLDMILTPLGEGRLALADSAAGARIGERALAEDPGSVAAFERLCEERFFGDPRIRELPLRDGSKSEPPRLAGQTQTMIELSRALAPVLDGVAASLEEAGYRVARIPFLFGGPESRAAEPNETGDRFRAGYPMLTYNNVLIEDDTDGKIVYLPSYGWDALDAAAARAWRSIGFAPRPIEGLVTSAMYGGALRCAVKVLAR
jgi:N-dimethylarginine dimethylaminohydrolase